MPFYLVIIEIRDQLKGRRTIQGVKEDPDRDINKVYHKFEYKYGQHFGPRMKYFSCYGLAKQSNEVKEYYAQKNKDPFPMDPDSMKDQW